MNPVIAMTMGDPGGVGPEVLLKSLKSPGLLKGRAIVVTGTPSVFPHTHSLFHPLPCLKRSLVKPGKIYFFDISDRAAKILGKRERAELRVTFGRISRVNASFAAAALEAAAEAAVKGEVDALVTAPVNKTAMRLVDPDFQGHTEYLAEKAGVRKFAMMFVGSRLCLTLATVHIALKDVSRNLSVQGVYDKIILTHGFLKKHMKKKRPHIAVCALNPHGEETGGEEKTVIRPAVLRARKAGVFAEGPFSADQLFYEAYEGRYDALVCMYHDQALGPFKMVSFHDGVNVTAGLPFIRTSPDHGTAFDIAGRGKANAASMTAAAALAVRLIRPR